MDFDVAFEHLIGHEGGYVDDPQDPGGETKYGISRRSYPGENIKELTLARAKQIARRDFWDASGCTAVPERLRFDLFDMAYNSGPKAAIKNLQLSVGAFPDGSLGPKTLLAVTSTPVDQVIMRFNGHRLIFMASLPNWLHNSRGWAIRVANNLITA